MKHTVKVQTNLFALGPGNSLLEILKVFESDLLLLVQLVLVVPEILERGDAVLDELLGLGGSDPSHPGHQIDGNARVVRPDLLQLAQFPRRQELVNFLADLLADLIKKERRKFKKKQEDYY